MENKCFFDNSECRNEKNISLYVIVDGITKLQNCCNKCLSKIQKLSNNSQNLDELDLNQSNADKKCLSCNSTFNDLLKNAKIGCALCYSYFEKELTFLIAHYQKSLYHKGKIPKQYKPVLIHNILKDLNEKLKNSKCEEKDSVIKLIENISSI